MRTIGCSFTLLLLCAVASLAAESLPKPTKIRVSERTKNSFRIDWEHPASQIYDRFSVLVSPHAREEEPKSLGTLSRKFYGLEAGERYTIFIQGFTADNIPSSVLKYQVWTVPDEPTGITTVPVHEISISISIMGIKTQFTALVDGIQVEWDDERENKMISGYDLQISPDDGVAVESDDVDLSSTVQQIITGLTPGKEYTVSLRTKVGPDYDPVYSKPVTSTMRMPPAIPYSVKVVETAPTEVTLRTHGPLEGIHDDLEFVMQPNHGRFSKPSPDPIFPMFDLYPLTGLKPGTLYSLQVYAMSKSVRGFKPYNITFSTTPAPPIKIRVQDFDHYSVTLQWNHAHKFSELVEVQYLIEFYEDPDGKLQSAVVKNFKINSPVVVQVHKLIPGTVYNFNVYTVLNGVKSTVPATVTQTTIPLKPTLTGFTMGNEKGVTVTFGAPSEGKCPSVKLFYSPGLKGSPVSPTLHKLGEEVIYEEIPTDGRYTIHARCVSMWVEGPELVISTLKEKPIGRNGTQADELNDTPTKQARIPLPCISASLSGKLIPRPDSIAPDACCNSRPYHSAEKECCGMQLVAKDEKRLCCIDSLYNKLNEICCDSVVRSKAKGCN